MEVIKFQSRPALENVLAMKGGDGDSSYAKSSSMQLIAVESVKPILERGIYENMRSMSNVGKNTLAVADTIVSAVQRSLVEQEMPEFEVFFIDLPSNDFNSLFRMLPPCREECTDVDSDCDKNPSDARSYIATAVCGSHFTRLLPRKTLHFCHTSMSLHWLSQVPESVQQRRSPRVYVSSDCEETVGAAYLQQFDMDFTAFLKARGEEIVDGGCMFICTPSRKPGSHIMEEQGLLGYIARDIENAFEELVNEGIIEKEKWESFNLPCFGPNLEEVENIVKREGSFAVEFVKNLVVLPYSMAHLKRGEENLFGELVANNYKAVFESIVEAHLGCEKSTEELFIRISKRVSNLVVEYLSKELDLVVAFLIKKGVHNKTI